MKSLSQLPWFVLLSALIAGPLSAAAPDSGSGSDIATPEAVTPGQAPEEIRAVDAHNLSASPEVQDIDTVSSPEPALNNETVRRYVEQVRQLEIANGAYNNDLVEALLGGNQL